MTGALGRLAAGAAVALLLGGCTSGGADSAATPSADAASQASAQASAVQQRHCRKVAPRVLAAIQTYVDAYGSPLAGTRTQPSRGSGPVSGDRALRSAIKRARENIDRHQCDAADYQQQISSGLADVTVRGPLARAVLLRLEASLSGASAVGAAPVTRVVGPRTDLAAVLAEVSPGSTLRLRSGTYRLDEALVLLQGVTLAGRGRGRTVLRSTAPDTALLVLTDGRVDLRDLSVRHAGGKPASVLVGGPSSSVALTGVTIGGARSGQGRAGGNGVLMSARNDAKASRATTLQVTGSSFSDNANAGILLTGGHRASIRRTRFDGNRQCGVCFADASSGVVHHGTFTANTVGVAALGRSRPAVLASTFSGGRIGVQAAGRAQVLVRDARISGADRAGMLFGDRSGGRVEDSSCRDVRLGIVVAPGAAPYLDRTSCTVVPSR